MQYDSWIYLTKYRWNVITWKRFKKWGYHLQPSHLILALNTSNLVESCEFNYLMYWATEGTSSHLYTEYKTNSSYFLPFFDKINRISKLSFFHLNVLSYGLGIPTLHCSRVRIPFHCDPGCTHAHLKQSSNKLILTKWKALCDFLYSTFYLIKNIYGDPVN